LSCEARPVGAFTAFLHPDSSAPELGYAVPTAPLPGDVQARLAAIDAVAEVFAARGQPLRIEYCLLCWPTLGPQLEDAGLTLAEEMPLFVVTPEGLMPRREPAVKVRDIEIGDDLAFVTSVMRQGFELRGGPPTPDEVAGLRAGLAAGLTCALAQVGEAPAGTGCASPQRGIAEITAVSTLPNLRRHGVAATLVTHLAERHFAAGGTLAWGAPPTSVAAGLLSSLGFVDAGVRVGYIGR